MKTYRAKDELFVRGRPEGEYIHPGEEFEMDEGRAAPLVSRGLAEEAGAKPVAKKE